MTTAVAKKLEEVIARVQIGEMEKGELLKDVMSILDTQVVEVTEVTYTSTECEQIEYLELDFGTVKREAVLDKWGKLGWRLVVYGKDGVVMMREKR